jgi:hypothetical protein
MTPTIRTGEPDRTLQVQRLSLSDLDERFIGQWLRLEERSLEANAYLSPHFVLPMLRHLERSGEVILIAVLAVDGGAPVLAGLGLFRLTPGNRRFPVKHLSAFAGVHSYLTGLLVDAALVEPVLEALFSFLTRPGAAWHGVAFSDWRADAPLGQAMLRAAGRAGVPWHPEHGFQRAILVPDRLGAGSFEAALARCTGKAWRKKVRRLVDQGEVRWRFMGGSACDAAVVERFLVLEDRGWVRGEGTSLRASGQENLFREVCQGFSSQGRLFITELLHHDEVIASTCNFISGREGFAFKIGWNTAFASLRPGLLNELLFLRAAREACAGLDAIDSGTTAGSFIEAFWEDRVTLQSGVFATSRVGRLAGRSWQGLRRARRGVLQRVARLRPGRAGKAAKAGKAAAPSAPAAHQEDPEAPGRRDPGEPAL